MRRQPDPLLVLQPRILRAIWELLAGLAVYRRVSAQQGVALTGGVTQRVVQHDLHEEDEGDHDQHLRQVCVPGSRHLPSRRQRLRVILPAKTRRQRGLTREVGGRHL